MTSLTSTVPPLPLSGTPVTGSTAPNIAKVWTLYFRKGSDIHTQQLNFESEGDLGQVIAQCKSFCEQVGYRFVRVNRFLVNLKAIAENHLKGSSF